jgi:hypothetical protein
MTALGFAINIVRQYYGCKTKGGFQGEIWWKHLRFIHVLIYVFTGILVAFNVTYATLILILDIIIGIGGKIYYS